MWDAGLDSALEIGEPIRRRIRPQFLEATADDFPARPKSTFEGRVRLQEAVIYKPSAGVADGLAEHHAFGHRLEEKAQVQLLGASLTLLMELIVRTSHDQPSHRLQSEAIVFVFPITSARGGQQGEGAGTEAKEVRADRGFAGLTNAGLTSC